MQINQINSIALKEEAAANTGWIAGSILDRGETTEFLLYPEDGRVAIVDGADVKWFFTDAETIAGVATLWTQRVENMDRADRLQRQFVQLCEANDYTPYLSEYNGEGYWLEYRINDEDELTEEAIALVCCDWNDCFDLGDESTDEAEAEGVIQMIAERQAAQ